MDQGSPPIPVRAREVLAYFLRNPKAADNLEGVARWRVPQEALRFAIDQIAHALNWLVEAGFLIKETGPGITPVFRLNEDRARDAATFLERMNQPVLVDTDGSPANQSRLLGPALAWVDATLILYLRENPPKGNDHPGLTRSHETVEGLLGTPLVDVGADVEAARRAYEDAAQELSEASRATDPQEPLSVLLHNLGLTWLEFQAVLLCMATEIDVKYQIAFAVLNDDMSRRAPTLALICGLLGDSLAVRTELTASGGLTRWRLIDSGAVLPHADEPIRLDQAIVPWLLGVEEALLSDARIASALRLDPWPGASWLQTPADVASVHALVKSFGDLRQPGRWLALTGDDSDGWRALVEDGSARAEAPLLRALNGATDPADAGETATRIARAVVLMDAVLVCDVAARPEGETSPSGIARIVAAVEAAGRSGAVIAPELERILGLIPREGCTVYRRDAPSSDAVAGAYAAAAAEAGLYLSALDAEQLAMAFPLPVGSIDSAIRLVLLEGGGHLPASEQMTAISSACRRIASPDLPRFARRVRPTISLEDVVLPKDRCDQLREMIAHVRYASRVLNSWGFSEKLPYGRGVAALFSGPSGTGKTMAAQAIAYELHTDAYIVDLSRVISKFVGETEKFIDAAFRDAQRAGAVLQIDEAEALFGKRSEVKDAHDRYANIEVAYLLQRMEAFDGVAILTTNLRQNLDAAFVRRLRFVIDFPRPEAAARERIWLNCLPKSAPFHEIDIRFLARRLDLTGGNIRQITLRAAFAAAAEGSETIEMRHLIAATRAELAKLGMPTAERDLAAFEAERRRESERVA